MFCFFFFFVSEFFRYYNAAQSSATVLVSFGGQEVTDAWSKSLILKNDLVHIKAPLSL